MTFVDHLLAAHCGALDLASRCPGGWQTVLVTPRFVTSRHMVALVYPTGEKDPRLVVKVPRQPGDNQGVRRETELLTALAGRVPGVPEVAGVVEAGRYTVLVETALLGFPLDPARVERDLDAATAAGLAFVDSLPATAGPSQNRDWYQQSIEQPLAALTALAPLSGTTAELVRRTHDRLAPLRRVALPAVVEHADLSHPNLLVGAGGALQVMDWERASLAGVPGHDLTFFLQYLSESVRGAYDRDRQVGAFDAAYGPGGWALPVLARHLRRHGIADDVLDLLVLTTWARSTATLADRLASEDPGATSAAIEHAVADDRDFWLWRHALDHLG